MFGMHYELVIRGPRAVIMRDSSFFLDEKYVVLEEIIGEWEQ